MNARLPLTLCAALLAFAAGCFKPVIGDTFDASYTQAVPCSPECLENETCVDGQCQIRTCENVRCLTGSSCVRGRCYATDCPSGACQPGFVCDGRRCVEAACAGVSCTYGDCVDGGCPACSQLEFFDADAGGCAPKKGTGQACGAPGDCATGFCSGGTCCESLCDAPCEACGTGVCTLRAALDPGAPACFPGRCNGASRQCAVLCGADSDCAPDAYCRNGTCVPDEPLGNTCARATSCDSGFCAQGVCCDQACNDSCNLCTAQVQLDGGVLPAGTCRGAPKNNLWSTCMPYRCQTAVLACPTSCSDDSDCYGTYCNAQGKCVAYLGVAAACTRDGECVSGNCRNGVCCSADCRGACKDCLADGGCSLKPDGVTDAGCANGGICAQGQCCNRACKGACERCDNPGLEGTCSPVAGAQYACNGYYACQLDGGCATSCFGPSGCSEQGFCSAGSCVKACDPIECDATNPGYCCTNNICSAPPPGQFCAN